MEVTVPTSKTGRARRNKYGVKIEETAYLSRRTELEELAPGLLPGVAYPEWATGRHGVHPHQKGLSGGGGLWRGTYCLIRAPGLYDNDVADSEGAI